MKFEEKELFGAAMIGFDMIDGPFLKWKRRFNQENTIINLDDFALNFYLSFRGGNGGSKPRAILYDNFYIVAFPKNLELCCLFMKPQGIEGNIKNLNKIASRIMIEMEDTEDSEENIDDSNDDDIEEIRRLIINMLNDEEMSTPELRRYFKLNNSQIWNLMSDLEETGQIIRTRKEGRAQMWTAA